MAQFVTRLSSESPPEVAFARVLDIDAQSEIIPFTVVASTDGQPLHEGSEFVGVTRIGPLRFDDTMRVAEFRPPVDGSPGRARIVKTGSVVTGWIDLDVVAEGSGGSRLTWTQEIGVALLPRVADTVVAWGAGRGYRAALGQLLRRS